MISYEYPPDTANGGIATYVYQAAKMLAERGNTVEVFAGSITRTGSFLENGVLVHRFLVKKQINFAKAIVREFISRHQAENFDVIEGPDFKADARAVVAACPSIPYVVKLHTPVAVLWQIEKPSLLYKCKVRFQELLHGINPFRDYERSHVEKADLIAGPSHALCEMLINLWNLDKRKVLSFPYPYIPSKELLQIPVQTNKNIVTFLGRLELRKGVIELTDAIPLILKEFPATKFRFVGQSQNSPDKSLDMKQYLINRLGKAAESVEFIEKVPLTSIPQVFAQTGVCVIPSRFENFGLVCLEAMSAGRAIVGSSNGGMSQMLNTNKVGRLVSPQDPEGIAAAVIELLADPEKRKQIGAAARQRVLNEYNLDKIGKAQEQAYQMAIENRKGTHKKDQINSPVLA